MAACLALCLWVGRAFGADSTVLEGWQFDDNSRSSWDLVWTCLSTVLACTWTAQHDEVPPRTRSNRSIQLRKIRGLLFALMTPEVITWYAVLEYYDARRAAAFCNSIQTTVDKETQEPTIWLNQRAKKLSQHEDNKGLVLLPVHEKWTVAQGFCITMGGVVLQTTDDWIYYIQTKSDVRALIESGVLRCSDFRNRDIEDRAKADSFAKAITVLQSSWVLINIVARAAYQLPISPLELCTVAYVVCAVLTYAAWWHKPKDMTTPIPISLPFTRDNLPPDLRCITDSDPHKWVHMRVFVRNMPFSAYIKRGFQWRRIFRQTLIRHYDEDRFKAGGVNGAQTRDAIVLVSVLVYCGIHIAAWNFPFPTRAEQIAWRVFTLGALAMALIVYLLGQLPISAAKILKKTNTARSESKAHLDAVQALNHLEVSSVFYFTMMYYAARLGMVALMFSSLRALPAGSYISIDWLASIPHL